MWKYGDLSCLDHSSISWEMIISLQINNLFSNWRQIKCKWNSSNEHIMLTALRFQNTFLTLSRKKSNMRWRHSTFANVIIHFFLCFPGLYSLFCKYGNWNAIVLKLEEVIKIHPASTHFYQSYLAQKCTRDLEF